MKKKNRLESLLSKIENLQRELYDYSSAMGDKADKSTDESKKESYNEISEYLTNAGFEFDESIRNIEDAIQLNESL